MTDKTSPLSSPVKTIPPDYHPPGCGFWFELPQGPDKGKRMFYRDQQVGQGAAEAVIVLVHGNPECSYSFRKIIRNLELSIEKPCRIIAMDHIGFGLSDQASIQMTAIQMGKHESRFKVWLNPIRFFHQCGYTLESVAAKR
jgi:pimeloyl-ACP methyl ester carboxylesterase